MKENRTRTSFTLKDETLNTLRAMSAETGIPMSNILDVLIKDARDGKKTINLRSKK